MDVFIIAVLLSDGGWLEDVQLQIPDQIFWTFLFG